MEVGQRGAQGPREQEAEEPAAPPVAEVPESKPVCNPAATQNDGGSVEPTPLAVGSDSRQEETKQNSKIRHHRNESFGY